MDPDNELVITYKGESGGTEHVYLGEDATVIGRDPGADVTLEGENVSRRHCEIRYWSETYVIKDLNSKNGTFVNGKQVDVAVIDANDVIGVGAFRLAVVHKNTIKLGETQAGEILEKMDEGKGYNTILHEIVDDLEDDDKS